MLNTISTLAMVQLGKVYENLMVDLRATNQKLWDRGARIISTVTTSAARGSDGTAPARRRPRQGRHRHAHAASVDRDEARRLLEQAGGQPATQSAVSVNGPAAPALPAAGLRVTFHLQRR